MGFQKASKKETKARIALGGVSGSGKTRTGLRVGMHIAKKSGGNGTLAVLDSERKSASKYVGEPNEDGGRLEFDVMELETHEPDTYVRGIREAEDAGYQVLLIDSLSHAWAGKGGSLEQVDRRAGNGSSFNAWREVTPMHNRLVDAILNSPMHIIVTMRSKTEYVVETVNGKAVPRKIGLAPVMRDGIEYEFDVAGDIDVTHTFSVTKTRCGALDGKFFHKPGADLADLVLRWLTDGAISLSEALEAENEEMRLKCHGLAKSIVAYLGDVEGSKWYKEKFEPLYAANHKEPQKIKAMIGGLTKKLAEVKAQAETAEALKAAAESLKAAADAGASVPTEGTLEAAEAALRAAGATTSDGGGNAA